MGTTGEHQETNFQSGEPAMSREEVIARFEIILGDIALERGYQPLLPGEVIAIDSYTLTHTLERDPDSPMQFSLFTLRQYGSPYAAKTGVEQEISGERIFPDHGPDSQSFGGIVYNPSAGTVTSYTNNGFGPTRLDTEASSSSLTNFDGIPASHADFFQAMLDEASKVNL